jgi:hypothetical protein
MVDRSTSFAAQPVPQQDGCSDRQEYGNDAAHAKVRESARRNDASDDHGQTGGNDRDADDLAGKWVHFVAT